MMKRTILMALIITLILGASVQASIQYAADSSRTSLQGASDGSDPEMNEVKSDTDKISVRGDSKAAKSWIKFDVSSLDIASMTECYLRITLLRDKTSTCSLSVVNDDCLDNIGWTSNDLTWNNAPGNYTSPDGINPDAAITLDELQDGLDPTKTTFVATVDYSYGGVGGDQFTFDVLSILQADTDGIVQFVLHGAGGSTDFTAHTYDGGYGGEDELENWHPALVYTVPEPASMVLLGLGGLIAARRKR